MAEHESKRTDNADLIRAEEPSGARIVIPASTTPTHDQTPGPTPDEVLAETELEDPDVGVDGTGVGELP